MRTVFLVAALVANTLSPAPAQTPSPSPSPVPSASPVASASPSPATSNVPSPAPTTLSDFARSHVDTMLRTGHADATLFSGTFLAQVSAAQVDAILARLKVTLGAYKSIDGTQGDYTAHFEKGTDEVLVHLDGDTRFDELFFKPPKL